MGQWRRLSTDANPPSRGDTQVMPAHGGGNVSDAYVDLYWLPLGAGGHSVKWNGRVFEAVVAAWQRRERYDLYHSGLEVGVPEGRYVIEMTPVRASYEPNRGVVAGGAVGSRLAGRFTIFRYEVRCWHGGVLPDVAEAVDGPQRLSEDVAVARRLLSLVPEVPTAVWGRDELRTGDMWNSNSLISWLIVGAGLDVTAISPPARGRAPGWDAGIVVARRRTFPPVVDRTVARAAGPGD